MAVLFDLKYHDDPGPKGLPDKNALDFLTELAKELRTQDNYGNASPRYFGLMHEEEYPTDSEYADSSVLFDDEGTVQYRDVPEDLGAAAEQFEQDVLHILYDTHPDWAFVCDRQEHKMTISGKTRICYCMRLDDDVCRTAWNGAVYTLSDLMDAKERIAEELDCEPEAILTDLSLGYVRKVAALEKDALFLTQKGAQDYLKTYGYNHKADCHSWCMTAVRSPEYEKLLQIIEETDWEALQALLAAQKG